MSRIIRAPRGSQITCKGWQQEAAMRMLMNNLDPEVAERPADLIVYGGTGKAARSWEAFDAIVSALRTLEDDETLLVQSGKPVGVFRTHTMSPRVLIANSNLVPHWATWDKFWELERKGLIMFGQMTAGSWIYIGTQGILQGTYETFGEAARQRFGGNLKGRLALTAGLGGMGGAQPLAVTMNEGVAIKRAPTYLHLHLGDHLIRTVEDGELATVQSTVALLRTIFEDHYVDPEHQSTLLFHGCTLSGSAKHPHDFTVVHRGERVILSEFTFKHQGPACVSLPLLAYTEELVKYSDTVLSIGATARPRPDWQQEFLDGQWEELRKLHRLARQLLLNGLVDYSAIRTEFIEIHGRLKRPLEMQIVSVHVDSGPRKPVVVQARIIFGPVGSGQRMPVRLNGGDVVLAHVGGFAIDGAILTLEGVGSGGVRIGDRLFGLQYFYP